MLQHALELSRRGLAVFPCWEIADGGGCACPVGETCSNAGKHPRTAHGFKDATANEELITSWWEQWPNANVAVATGEVSGVDVVDVDPRNGGLESMSALTAEIGALPLTPAVLTGGGGMHLYFIHDPSLRGRHGFRPGVDFKANGGYVVAPPSSHAKGSRYRWAKNRSLDVTVPAIPAELRAILLRRGSEHERQAVESGERATGQALMGVSEGERNNVLFRAACRWRRLLRDDRGAVRALVHEAARQCDPPYPPDEVETLLESAFAQDHSDEGPVSVPSLSDLGNARRLQRLYGDELRFVEELGWLRWDGLRWQTTTETQVLYMANQLPSDILADLPLASEEPERQAIIRWAETSAMQPRLTASVSLLKGDPTVRRESVDLDQHQMLLAVANGVVDLRTGEMVEGDIRALEMTQSTDTPYIQTAEAKRWLQFLDTVMPDQAMQDYVQRCLGYSLTGLTSEKQMFIVHGRGDNGKTVLLETVKHVLGDHGGSAAAGMIVGRNRSAIPNDIARLRGTRLVILTEPPAGQPLASELVKQLTGGDTITARFLRREWIEFDWTAKLWLTTNQLPTLPDGGDEAVWRRLRVIPFDVVIPASQQEPRDQLQAALQAESAGILAWLVRGCLAWQERGLIAPASVREVSEEYKMEADWLGEFLDDECVLGGEETCMAKDVYGTYQMWSSLCGRWPVMSRQALGQMFRGRGFTSIRVNGGQRGWRGVGLQKSDL